jgi:hypothetical protein
VPAVALQSLPSLVQLLVLVDCWLFQAAAHCKWHACNVERKSSCSSLLQVRIRLLVGAALCPPECMVCLL